jgi:hypothetical protein
VSLVEQLESLNVAPDQLLLDPNNPRLLGVAPTDAAASLPDTVALDSDVQAELVARLKREVGIDSLVEKIRSNGFLPIDRVVVRPCRDSDGQFVVLEGNRRIAALKTILRESLSLAELSEDIRATFSEIDVLVYHGDDPMIAWSIQGLRHIEGVKEWGPFQRAAFLASLAERHEMPVTQIARLAGLRPNISNRLVRSYQGLRQAQEDPDWGTEIDEPDFAIFNEAIFAKNHSELWKWLEWNDSENTFENEENLSVLLALLKDEQADGRPVIQRVNPDLRDHFQRVLASDDRDALIEDLRSGNTTIAKVNQQLTEDDLTHDLQDVDHSIQRLRDLAAAVEILPMPAIVAASRSYEIEAELLALQRTVAVQLGALAGASAQSSPSAPATAG